MVPTAAVIFCGENLSVPLLELTETTWTSTAAKVLV